MAEARKRKLREELKSSWFIPLRLSIFLLLFGGVILSEGSGVTPLRLFLLYSVVTLLFLFLIEVNIRLIKPWLLSAVIFLHLTVELAIEGSIIQCSGHLTSQYSILFLLTIISASLAYRLAGTLLVATLASVVFTLATSLDPFLFGGTFADLGRLSKAFSSRDDIFYAVFLHVCTFYLIAFISGFLVEKLRVKEGELFSTSKNLERARLDTDDILLNLHSGLLTIDNRGDIVYFNRTAESILGMKEKDVKGRSFMGVFNKTMPEFAERILSVLKLSQAGIRTELEITDKNGRTIPLGLTTSVLGDERVGIRGVIAVFQDLTAAKKLEDALMKADRLAVVGELSARIAHEIRNPLASISGSVEVLKSELQLAGENQRLMELIVKESERLSRILSDFLSYARMQPAVRVKVELISVLEDTIKLLQHDLDLSPQIKFDFKTDFTTAYIVADEDQLRQILINLITNAFEAVDPKKGQVEVDVSRPDARTDDVSAAEWTKLTITDNGSGFDPQDRERIFEPFFSRKKGGTGLGLAVVRRCVDNLGARIRVDTTTGAGTTFTILFRRYLSHLERTQSSVKPIGDTSLPVNR